MYLSSFSGSTSKVSGQDAEGDPAPFDEDVVNPKNLAYCLMCTEKASCTVAVVAGARPARLWEVDGQAQPGVQLGLHMLLLLQFFLTSGLPGLELQPV